MKLKWEDLDQLFSIYMIVPKIEANIFERAKARQEERRGLYERYKLRSLGKRYMKRVAKDAERKIIDGRECVLVDGQRYEIIQKL